MDNLQQQIAEIAQQIPGYAGYQAKERRRNADKLVRTQRFVWRALTIIGFSVVLLALGLPARQARASETLELVITLKPPELDYFCVGGTWLYEMQVWYRRMPIFNAHVTMTTKLAGKQELTMSDKLGIYTFMYKPTKAGKEEIEFRATYQGTSDTKTFNVVVKQCEFNMSLNDRGTYQFQQGGASATFKLFAVMDQSKIRLGRDGKYSGKGDVFFSENISGKFEDCSFVSTPAEATTNVDLQGATDDTGESLNVAMTFQKFSATWTITGSCSGESVDVFPPPGNVDLNSLWDLSSFVVASSGGTFTQNHSIPGWSGEGTVTITVYPEEESRRTSKLEGNTNDAVARSSNAVKVHNSRKMFFALNSP